MFSAFRHHHPWGISQLISGMKRLSPVFHIPWPLGTPLAFSIVPGIMQIKLD